MPPFGNCANAAHDDQPLRLAGPHERHGWERLSLPLACANAAADTPTHAPPSRVHRRACCRAMHLAGGARRNTLHQCERRWTTILNDRIGGCLLGPDQSDNRSHSHRRMQKEFHCCSPIRLAPIKDEQKSCPHSITSSASASKVGGRSTPSVFAVFRLSTSSNRVGCITGRSAGLSPRRTRPT